MLVADWFVSVLPTPIAHRGHRAAYAEAPAARPMGARARLVALRKDGTTFPAEISLSPVATATGSFTLTVIRDVTEARRLADLADLALVTVTAKQAHLGQGLLDSITTDHISPAGSIKIESPAGEYLRDHQVRPKDFNQYGTRRGNHQVMMRGTFGNIRIKNQMLPGVEGGFTVHYPSKQRMTIYDAAMKYKAEGVPLVVFAGKEYGTGSSRDWAAKGSLLLGIRAVVCQSFERIHRSNLVGMGIMPLVFEEGTSWQTLGLKGDEQVTIRGLHGEIKPGQKLIAEIVSGNGTLKRVPLICRIDTADELEYYKNGGILQYVLRQLAG